MPDKRTAARIAWMAPVVLTGVVWLPIIRSYFHADDFLNLYELRNEDAVRYLLHMYGGHLLIARNEITAALDAVFGPDPRPFQILMLITHLINTGLLYALVLALSGSWRLAVVAAAVWGTAPANEGALGWYSVYGQVAATTCILGVVVDMARVREGAPPGWVAPTRWAALMLLAGMLFGVGIAAALAMPAVAWLMLPPGAIRRRAVVAVAVAAVALLAIYAAVRALELPLYGDQRIEITYMLTGLRAADAFRHLRMLGGLLGFGFAALPLGPLFDPKRFPTSMHMAVIAAVALLLVCGAAANTRPQRRRLLACVLLVVATYGLIAIARSMFVDSLGLTALTSSPRFHYAAGAFLSAALALAVYALAVRWRLPPRAAHAAFAVAALTIGWMALGAERPRLDHFDGDRRETERVLREISAAVAAAPPGATVEIPNQQFGSVGYINVGDRERFPGTAAVFVIFYPENVVAGRRIVFTTNDPLVLEGARKGRRSAALLRELPRQEASPAK